MIKYLGSIQSLKSEQELVCMGVENMGDAEGPSRQMETVGDPLG